MKLRRGKSTYKFPPHSQVFAAYIEGNQRHNQMCHLALQLISPRDLANIPNPPILGIPICTAIAGQTITFYPVPDKPYVVKVRYAPPIQEF